MFAGYGTRRPPTVTSRTTMRTKRRSSS